MSEAQKCAVCGGPLPGNAGKRNCPACLFRGALNWQPTAAGLAETGGEYSVGLKLGLRPTHPLRFGEYELLEEIGRGGTGVVYRARQVSLDRVVALKMLIFGSVADAVAVKRFRVEAVAAASLRHPNIVAIHEIGMHADQQFLVMDYVDGPTLEHLVSTKPLSAKFAARYLVFIAEAVEFAHQRGLLHRDLKPSNILIDSSDQPRVTDFGLAKRFNSNGALVPETLGLTLTGQVVGSPGFMAPEQAAGKHRETSPATDVYALGAVLYFLLTGRAPFVSETLADALHQVLQSEPISPRRLNASVPRDLETVCLKCLEKDPRKRYATAQMLRDDLGRFLAGEPIQIRPVSRFERARRWCRRRPAVTVLTGIAILLLLSVVIGSPIAIHNISSSRLLAEERLYVADMNLAHEAWENGDLQRAQLLLTAHLPQPGRPDMRGFEWRYLWQLCRDESRHVLTNFVGQVGGVALSPDGGLLAVADAQGIKILEFGTWRQLLELHDPDTVANLAFSSGNTRLLASAGGNDHKIKLWDLQKRTSVAEFDAGPNRGFSVALSPDGRWLAASDQDRTLTVFDLQHQAVAWVHRTAVVTRVVRFSPDSHVLLSGGGEAGLILVWDPATGKPLPGFGAVHTGWIEGLALSSDGRLLASCARDGRIVLWNYEQRRALSVLLGHKGHVLTVTFSPDGRRLASAGDDNVVRVWNVASAKEEQQLRGSLDMTWSVLFTPDGETIISSGADRAVRLWNSRPPRSLSVAPGHQQWLYPVAVSPDGRRVAAMETHTGVVRLWNQNQQLITNFVPHAAIGVFVAFSPDSGTLASGSYDRTVRLWDMSTLGLICTLTNRFEAGALAFSPDGKLLAVAGLTLNPLTETNRLTFWDVASRKQVSLLPQAAPLASAVTFSDDGCWLATGHFDGGVRIWDLRTRRLAAAFRGHSGMVWSVAFSRDSRLLASGGSDRDVHVYDIAKRSLRQTFSANAREIWSVAFAPDGRTLVSGSTDGQIRFWNLATASVALTLNQRLGQVNSVAFSRDGSLLVSAGVDGDVWFWPAGPPGAKPNRKQP